MIDNIPYRYAIDAEGEKFLRLIDDTYDREFIVRTLPHYEVFDDKGCNDEFKFVTIVHCREPEPNGNVSYFDLVEMIYTLNEDDAASTHAQTLSKWNNIHVVDNNSSAAYYDVKLLECHAQGLCVVGSKYDFHCATCPTGKK